VATTLDRTQVSPRPKHPARRRVVNRLIGVGFGAAAIFNAG
jgi:hypothetical protein